MKLYFAPLEGIGGYVLRSTQGEFFEKADKYFAPFVSPNSKGTLKRKDRMDLDPGNNPGEYLVPQILANDADMFVNTARDIQAMGYEEINLNLGCPSKTVVTKGKGSGFLDRPEELRRFLDEIYSRCPMKISIKTRVGMEDGKRWPELLELFARYPVHELIVHPRLQTDYYRGPVRPEFFLEAVQVYGSAEARDSRISEHGSAGGDRTSACGNEDAVKIPLVYNGDIFNTAQYEACVHAFPGADAVMIGRGAVGDPGIFGQIRTGTQTDKAQLEAYHEALLQRSREACPGDTVALNKLKEIWFYMGHIFTEPEKYMKQIRKAKRVPDYEAAVRRLFREQELTTLSDAPFRTTL